MVYALDATRFAAKLQVFKAGFDLSP